MAVSPLFKRWLHIAGGFLGLAGLFFVVRRLLAYSDQIDLCRFDAAAWVSLVLLALIYGLANILLARAWWQLLPVLGLTVRWRWALKAYGLSQLAKYIPGNIFHLAGRQALGMAAGLPTVPLAKSAFWELVLIAVSGTLFGILALPLVWGSFSMAAAAILFLAVVGGLLAIVRLTISSAVSAVLFLQIVFLAISGMIFVAVLALVQAANLPLSSAGIICGAYVVAWLAGLVTPGAPAGVGIREMVLLFLLGAQIAQADLLLAIVLGRGVTVIGDVFYFTLSGLIKPLKLT